MSGKEIDLMTAGTIRSHQDKYRPQSTHTQTPFNQYDYHPRNYRPSQRVERPVILPPEEYEQYLQSNGHCGHSNIESRYSSGSQYYERDISDEFLPSDEAYFEPRRHSYTSMPSRTASRSSQGPHPYSSKAPSLSAQSQRATRHPARPHVAHQIDRRPRQEQTYYHAPGIRASRANGSMAQDASAQNRERCASKEIDLMDLATVRRVVPNPQKAVTRPQAQISTATRNDANRPPPLQSSKPTQSRQVHYPKEIDLMDIAALKQVVDEFQHSPRPKAPGAAEAF